MPGVWPGAEMVAAATRNAGCLARRLQPVLLAA
jgi:hypothetical protein